MLLLVRRVNKSNCAVTQGKVDLGYYQNLDGYWRELGISAPARRGLIDQKAFVLTDLRKLTKTQFLAIHGIGPKAEKIIIAAMKRQKISFKAN